MATRNQRVKAHIDAIRNQDTGAAIITRAVDAICFAMGQNPALMTDLDKLDHYIQWQRDRHIEALKAYEAHQAALSTRDAAWARVDTDFQTAP